MASPEQITNVLNAIKLSSECLVQAISTMQKLSAHGYSKERDEITLQIGRLQVLHDRVSDEVPDASYR